MNPAIPRNPYPFERLGAKDPKFEIGQHTQEVRQEILAKIVSAPGTPSSHSVSLWMSVPDARLLAVLSIVFEPDLVAGLGPIDTSTIHLMSTEDCQRDPAPVEDLIGSAAVPARLVQEGLRGFQYSPTEEVEGLRADLYLESPLPVGGNQGYGRWVAKARWQGLHPMSAIEWRDAVSKMVLLVSPAGIKTLNIQVPA